VAAAVVLREGQEAGEADIRQFLRERLADYKIPRKVLILEEIPKGATGKLQRIGLAEKLGLA
jgi:acyl-CoA synthetase (AMP-forming)/AMP-acid ligase II